MYTTFFRLVIHTHGRMPESTWRICTEFESAWNFTLISRVFLVIAWSLWGFSSLAVSLFCLRMGCGRRRSPFSSLAFTLASRGQRVTTETAWVSFGTLSMCFPLKTLSHLPLNVGFVSFLTLGNWSSFHTIVSDSEISISHHLIIMKFNFSFLIADRSVFHRFEQPLEHKRPSQSEVEQNSVILTCIILPGSRLKAFRLLLSVRDPILNRNLGRRHSAYS